MSVDVTPVTNALMQLAAAVVLAVGTWAVSRFVQWLGLKNAAQATANLDDVLQKGVTYGLQQSLDLIKQKGWDHVDVRNQVLDTALPYVISRFPDTLAAVGLDPNNTQDLTDKVRGALDRAFPHAAAVAAASPATPPATAPDPPTTRQLASQPNVSTTIVEEARA